LVRVREVVVTPAGLAAVRSSTLCGAAHCAEQHTVRSSTLCGAAHCAEQHTVRSSTLCGAAHLA